jgi:hypothetical protein
MKASNGSLVNITQPMFYLCALGLEDLNLIAMTGGRDRKRLNGSEPM